MNKYKYLKKKCTKIFAVLPESKNKAEIGRSSGSPGFLRLPIRQSTDSGMDSETFLSGHTAAGTAPEFHRIPFLIHPIGKDRAKPNFNAKLQFLMFPVLIFR